MGRIDQFLSTFAPRDAQGNHALQVRSALRDMGVQSDIYAMDGWPELRREAAKLGIEGRSKMGKAQLVRAVGQKRRSR